MLAQVREEYVFATVNPAVVLDKKAELSRTLIRYFRAHATLYALRA
jgi:hypothetical protein